MLRFCNEVCETNFLETRALGIGHGSIREYYRIHTVSWRSFQDGHGEAVAVLLNQGADRDANDSNGRTARDSAVDNGRNAAQLALGMAESQNPDWNTGLNASYAGRPCLGSRSVAVYWYL